MRTHSHPFVGLVAAAALCGPLAPAGAAQHESEFMAEFRQALADKDSVAMERLVKEHEQAAVVAVIETCDRIAVGSSDQLEEEIDGLRRAWRATFDSQFVGHQYEYVSLLTPVYKRSRVELVGHYQFKSEELERALGDGEESKLPALGMDFLGLGDGFDELGDYYMASVGYLRYAQCFDEEYLGRDADLKRACEGYGKCLAMREKVELKDSVYTASKARFDELEFAGYGDPSKGPEARARRVSIPLWHF